jgi:hypothetical protein
MLKCWELNLFGETQSLGRSRFEKMTVIDAVFMQFQQTTGILAS